MEDPGDPAGKDAPKGRGGKKPRGLFRRKSLRSVGEFMSRVMKALGTLSHLGGEAEPGGQLEDDDGGFKRKPATAAATMPGDDAAHPRGAIHGGDNNNNHLGRARGSVERLSPAALVPEKTPGVQGLKNHGNTCFMNAVVQCLSNTDLLAEYLGLERYRQQLDPSGSPGPGGGDSGQVTQQLAALVRALWTLEYIPQLSVEFKVTFHGLPDSERASFSNRPCSNTSTESTVSKFGPQFRGNSQHDALEFLLWLLDRVHEDLNTSAGQKSRAPAKVTQFRLCQTRTELHDPGWATFDTSKEVKFGHYETPTPY